MVSTRRTTKPSPLAPVPDTTTSSELMSPISSPKPARRGKKADAVVASTGTTVMPATAASTAKEVTLVSPTADAFQDFSKLQTSSSGHNYRFIMAAMLVAGLIGVYIGARFFSENTAPVKELCDRNIALIQAQGTEICTKAVASMADHVKCTTEVPAWKNMTQLLERILPLFLQAARKDIQ